MPGDMTRPRKKKYTLDDIKNDEQRALASYIKPKMEGMTLKKFAEAEPKISLATLSNIFAPAYNGVPTARILKLLAQKISNLSGDSQPEIIYEELLKRCGYLLTDFPYEKPHSNIIPLTEAQIRNALLMKLMNMSVKGCPKEDCCFKKHKGIVNNKSLYHDLAIDYTDLEKAPIAYWTFDFFITGSNDTFLLRNNLQTLFYMILTDETKNNVKYSIITNSEILYNELSSMKLPALNLYISAILYKNGDFKETYVDTALFPGEIKATLSL